jgi:hypothetical protein
MSVAPQPSVGPWPLLQFLDLFTYSVELLDGGSARRKASTAQRTTQTQNKRTQTFMTWVGFEPTIPEFQRAKTFRALDRAATVIGS